MIPKDKKRITITLTAQSYKILLRQHPGLTTLTKSQILNAILGVFDEYNLSIGFNDIWRYNDDKSEK